jgi:hypothetical protein
MTRQAKALAKKLSTASPRHRPTPLSAAAEFAHINGWKIGAKFDGHFAANSQTYAGIATVRYGW